MGVIVSCRFCGGTGDDKYLRDRCRACGGSGSIVIPYDNAVACNFCSETGDDRYNRAPCRVCGGAGKTAPGLQSI